MINGANRQELFAESEQELNGRNELLKKDFDEKRKQVEKLKRIKECQTNMDYYIENAYF